MTKARSDARWPEVLLAFMALGLTSFGGPIAHLGYFRAAFVEQRRWIEADRFAGLLALCQLLPGPASSQLGMAIGHARAGWAGALAAWIGFTLPSAALMTVFAWGAGAMAGGGGWLHGLKLAAVAVVAQAVLLMARRFAATIPSAVIAILAGAATGAIGGAAIQAAVILAGALAGGLLLTDDRPASPTAPDALPIRKRTGLALLGLCLLLLVGAPLIAGALHSPALAQAAAYLRAGALVFGGGHVVLPLLEQGVVAAGAIDRSGFLAAYGAAQALPGPLFAVAAYPGYLGAPGGVWGAAIAIVAIFLPGALILFGALPFWSRLAALPKAAAALAGSNAAVVGLLGAALWNPLWRSSVESVADMAIAAFALLALMAARAPPFIVVMGCAIASWARLSL